MDGLLEVLALRGGYNTNVVLAGATLLGIAAGVVGTFAMLRERALVADALSHAALPGALVSGLAAAAWIEALSRPRGGGRSALSGDTATAVVLASTFGLGTVLLGLAQRAEGGGQAGLAGLVFGRTAGMLARDAYLMAALAAVALVAAAALGRAFAVVAFNERFAATTGLPVRGLDRALSALVALVTLAGMQAVGMLLVVALLVGPPATARFFATRVRSLALLAGLFGGLSGLLGSALSATLPNAPAGAVIVLVACGFFALALGFAPARGVLAIALRRRALAAAARRGEPLGPVTTAALAAPEGEHGR